MHTDASQQRRLFLQAGAAITASMLTGTALAQSPESDSHTATEDQGKPDGPKVRLAVIGANNRGTALIKGFNANPNAEVVAVCDVDSEVLQRTAALIDQPSGDQPTTYADLRHVLDRPDIDAIVVATPNHWHAPATILGCAASKHVYVEKPCSQTPEEGVLAVQAARKHNRVVMMGSQRRSWPAVIAAMDLVHSGRIGKVHYARTWYNNRRTSIGLGKQVPAPQTLDWDLWQGPAPRRPYVDNIVHYNWHWNWHWGNGELGNNGIHVLDLARWGMQVTHPNRVTAGGGKYRHQDDQQTPDTMMVTYDFPESKTITWEGLSWSPMGAHDTSVGVSFHGSEGTLVIFGQGYTLYDDHNKEIETVTDAGGDTAHLDQFVQCIQNGGTPNTDIQVAHDSTLLTHLGNMAFRTGGLLNIDPKTGKPLDNEAATALWGREYANGWKPVV
ncbi:MAG: Gfo/Idh/MocA family oxidoreductase [Rubripirellula sp.]